MRSCLKSNDELTLEVQSAQDEHRASVDKIIRQATQLADVVREIQENKARILSDEHKLDQAEVSETTGGTETLNTEHAMEMLVEEHREVREAERVLAEENSLLKIELLTTPQGDEESKEDSEEANDEPQKREKEEEVIEHCGGPEATLFYL